MNSLIKYMKTTSLIFVAFLFWFSAPALFKHGSSSAFDLGVAFIVFGLLVFVLAVSTHND